MVNLILYAAACLSVLAFGISVVSLAIHYSRRNEHPAVTQLRAEQLDLLDKVEHWIKRDRVRRLRASQEEQQAQPEPAAITPQEVKQALRHRVFGRSQ